MALLVPRSLFARRPRPAACARRAAHFLPVPESLEGRALLSTTAFEVNPGDPDAYQTIQAAVDAAPAGATIQVAPGTYHESVTIPATKNNLTIIGGQVDSDGKGGHDKGDHDKGDHDKGDHGQGDHGQGGPSIVEPTGLYGFDIQANDVTVENFTVQAINTTTNSVGFNLARSASGDQVLDNVIRNNTFGIYLNSNGHDTTVIADNQVLNNNNEPVNFSPSNQYSASGNGIYSDQGASNVLIRDNYFSGQSNASVIFVGGPAAATSQSRLAIVNNRMINDSAIILVNTTQSVISGNTNIGSNGYAVLFGGGVSNVAVTKNTFRNGAFSGISVDFRPDFFNLDPAANNHDLQISGNTITGFQFDGITLAGGTYNDSINNNTVNNNGFHNGLNDHNGISLTAGAFNGLSVYNNTVSNNTVNNNGQDGISLTGGAHDNTVSNNTANKNGRYGIFAGSTTSNNTFRKNSMHGNAVYDAADNSHGTGTAGTANIWVDNSCDKANPPGICTDHGNGHGDGENDNGQGDDND